ncbi:MAG: Gfo/Idh/MocA family oxidoreductase [Gammaproteobacteria bacterium]|nr:Gfo/Idh/MocA family oxidoreductase [Gammaproteobacteria bacterium]
MTTYRVMLVGLGQIGCGYDVDLPVDTHVMTHARASELHPGLTLVAAVDPSAEARARFAHHYAAPVFASLAEAASVGSIDVLILAAPTALHPRLLAEGLAVCTPRLILCEKPLATSMSEARVMVDACVARGIAVYVNYMRCVEPGALEMERRLQTHQWAPPYAAVVWYTKGLRHNASHFWTLAERWFGPTKQARVTSRDGAWEDGDARVAVRAVHAEAVVHYLPVPDGPLSHHGVEILAGNGRARYDHGGRVITWEPRVVGVPPTILGREFVSLPTDFDRFQWYVADALVAALDGRPQALCTGAEALAGLSRLSPLLES